MRHVLLQGTMATRPCRMGQATATARLVAPGGSTLGVVSRLLRTAAATVNLAAVAVTADEHLSLAAGTQEQSGRPFHGRGFARAWTTSATGGILPRHACPARCGGTAPIRTWQFRPAPCLSSDSSSPHHCALHTSRNAAIAHRPVDMWTTQGRCPHTHRVQQTANQINLIVQEKQVLGRREIMSADAPASLSRVPPSLRGSKQPFTSGPTPKRIPPLTRPSVRPLALVLMPR
jgi:hypothetical protein